MAPKSARRALAGLKRPLCGKAPAKPPPSRWKTEQLPVLKKAGVVVARRVLSISWRAWPRPSAVQSAPPERRRRRRAGTTLLQHLGPKKAALPNANLSSTPRAQNGQTACLSRHQGFRAGLPRTTPSSRCTSYRRTDLRHAGSAKPRVAQRENRKYLVSQHEEIVRISEERAAAEAPTAEKRFDASRARQRREHTRPVPDIGADAVVSGGQTMNPYGGHPQAVNAVPAELVCAVNNKNIIMTAR